MFARFLVVLLLAVLASAQLIAQTNTPRRAPWITSRITGAPEPPRPYVAERVFPSLKFEQPVELVAIPGANRLLILEVGGKIFSFENQPTAERVETDLFADIKLRDPSFSRLYGFTFHPKFAENRTCFISYVLKDRQPDGSRVSRFKVTATNPPRLIPESEEILVRWYAGGHNGAHLQFGPEGYLYISTGDGGDAFPPDGRKTGQDLSDLEAALLRIDVDHRDGDLPYRIPSDNPFVGRPNSRGEIWAYGVRNPWKMCFDPADGSLWVGDVGWEMWEMVYHVTRGANYGWSVVEGPQPVLQEHPPSPTPIVPPAVAHSHIEARSITGGYFSQTSRLPELQGTYVYGDYVTGKVWGLKHDGDKITWRDELVDTPLQIVSFGLDQTGDVLLLDYPTGTLHRLAPNPRRGANDNFPRKLSETGLFSNTAKHEVAAGVIPYRVNAEAWADGTTAERFVALPAQNRLNLYSKSDAMIGFFAGDWKFPDGSVLAKTIFIDLNTNPTRERVNERASGTRRRLETQILHFDFDTWKAYNYLWNDEQTDAVLADDVGSDRVLRGAGFQPAATEIERQAGSLPHQQQTWHHASRTECLLCHTSRVGTLLGFRPEQLADLQALDQIGLFANPPKTNRPTLPNPHDESAPLESRARAYLHVNCGHCHTRGGGGSSFFDMQFHLTLAKSNLIGSRPTQGTFGILGAEIIAPGDPYRSVLYYRMSKLGHGRMPQFGSQVVDSGGTKLIHEWIASLKQPSEDPSGKAIERMRIENRQTLSQLSAHSSSAPQWPEKQLSTLLSTPSGALFLADFLRTDGASTVRNAAIALGYAHPDPAIRDLFERFIPEDQRIKRLGGTIKPAEILAMTADAARGRELFFQSTGTQCKNCHKIGDQGQTVGPDLSQIGKKLDKPKLLESILEPSKTIDPQFVSHLVETKEGEVHTGLLLKRTDAELVLKKADGKDLAIPATEIERAAPQQKSLMPELLLRDMTAQQAADLLEYLAGLK